LGKKKQSSREETGTINDRIFEVLPKLRGQSRMPKLVRRSPTGQKFRLATGRRFLIGELYPFNGILAGISQAKK